MIVYKIGIEDNIELAVDNEDSSATLTCTVTCTLHIIRKFEFK